jgi:hypothetical protein
MKLKKWRFNAMQAFTGLSLMLSLNILDILPVLQRDNARKISAYKAEYKITADDCSRKKEVKKIKNKIKHLLPEIDITRLDELAGAIYDNGYEYDLDFDLLVSIAFQESEFVQKAVSPAGCLGYFQINVKAHPVDLNRIYDAHYNTALGCRVLTWKIRAYNGNIHKALDAYSNWTPNYAKQVLQRQERLKNIAI